MTQQCRFVGGHDDGRREYQRPVGLLADEIALVLGPPEAAKRDTSPGIEFYELSHAWWSR